MREKSATVGQASGLGEPNGPDRHVRRERAISAIAARQHGVVTVRQLLAIGFSHEAIRRRVDAGRLHRIRRGVYAVGHSSLTTFGRRLAAVLACGARAVASHTTAAAVWGIRPDNGRVFHITTTSGSRGQDDIRIHHVAKLVEADRKVRDAVPVTAVARTLVDLGDVVPSEQVRAAFVRAEQLRLLDMRAIDEALGRASRRKGPAVLREILRAYDPRWQETRSPLELRILDLIAAHGLPEPEVNAWVSGRWMVDFLWRDERVVLEADGAFAHGTAGARRRDALRERHLRQAGFTVLRASYDEVVRQPEKVLAVVLASLGRGT